MTEPEWFVCVGILKATFGRSFDLDKAAIGVWFELLADLPGSSVKAAVLHLCRSTKAFPSVAEIREIAEDRIDPLGAWGEVLAQVSKLGSYPVVVTYPDGRKALEPPRPEFTDPATADAIAALGGWQHVCEAMKTADEATWRAQFREAFKAASIRRARAETRQAVGAPQTPMIGQSAPRLLGGK